MGRCNAREGERQRADLASLAVSLKDDPAPVLDPLLERMRLLARLERFEEAAELRDRAGLLERTLIKTAEARALIDAGEVALTIDGHDVTIARGRLRRTNQESSAPTSAGVFIDPEAYVEASVISSFLRKHAAEVQLMRVAGAWSHPASLGAGGRFRARVPDARSSRR
jgi:excinuclease UvrABC nuclease subunit